MAFWKRWRLVILGIAVSLGAIYFIGSQMNLERLGEAFRQARYIYLVPTLILVFLGLACRAVRWRILLSDGLPLMRAFNILNVTYLINGIIPFRVGEVARAYLATRADPPVPLFKSASTIIVERLLDLLAVLVILALALFAAPLPGELRAAALFFAPITLVGFIVLVFMAGQRAFVYRWVDRAIERAPILRRFNLRALVGHFLDGLAPLATPKALANALLWTAISWAFSLASGYVLMLAFWDNATWAAVCLFTASASFAVAVPAVPGNLGTYEASIFLALGVMGYGEPQEKAIAFAVMIHAANLGMNALLGIIGFMGEGVTLGQLSQGVRGAQTAQVEAGA